MKRHTIGLAAAVLLLGLGRTHGAVVFSNFGPGDTYNTASGYILGTVNGYAYGDAFDIVSPDDVILQSIELAVGLSSGPNELDVALRADASGLPGVVIEAFHFTGAMGLFGDSNPPLIANSVLQPTLQAGERYWVTASVPYDPGNPNATTTAIWNRNSTGDIGPHASALGVQPWQVDDQLRK